MARWFFLFFVIASANAQTDGLPHTLEVSDPGLRREIESKGGVLLGDYGGYRLYSVNHLDRGWAGRSGVELRDDYHQVHLNTGDLDTRKPELQRARIAATTAFGGKQLRLIQFTGPPRPEWLGLLTNSGARIVCYVPRNAYLVYADHRALQKIRSSQPGVIPIQWEGRYEDDYKIHPLARITDGKGRARKIGTELFEIQLLKDDPANAATLRLIDSLKLEPAKSSRVFRDYLNLIVRLDQSRLATVSRQPDVISILPYFEPVQLCERQDQIVAGNITNGALTGPGYLGWLASLGFTQAQFDASGILVDVTDSGVDNGTTAPWHFGLYSGGVFGGTSRMMYARLSGYPSSESTLSGCDGHGNLTAHIIGGYDSGKGFPFADSSGYHYGLGVCPFTRMGSSVIFDPYFTYPDYTALVSAAYASGARISCNSWGEPHMAVYNSSAQTYDALVRDAQPTNGVYDATGDGQISIVFAAGNGGPSAQSVQSPATAKNIISVGAADNVQPFGAPDGHSMVGDADSTNANQVIAFSGRGPCSDGRVKPDIMAPGTHVSGGVMQMTNDLYDYPDGIADSCYNGSGISGGTNGSAFWPDGQQFYTASSGTSQAAPCVAGGCALVMQYFQNTRGSLPSPAMLKAILLNSARYLDGSGAGGDLPSDTQGFGEMNLGRAFDAAHRILRDQIPSDLFTNSGALRAVTATVSNTNLPLRVTLAWTDAPGSTFGAAYNNDLDLAVRCGTNVYKGNVFGGQYSVTGGNADYQNNVESVFLPPGVSGGIVVTVTAANINSEAVPLTNGAPSQDFALVVYNADAVSMPYLVPAGATLAAESCQPTNGVIDPGETVTVDFGIQNIGTLSCSNPVVTLLTNSQVRAVANVQNPGPLASSGGVAQIPFTFKALGGCGSTFTVDLLVRDGTNTVGTFSYPFTLGMPSQAAVFTENFDSLASPALPSGWLTSATNAQSPWAATADTWDTSPNSLSVGDPSGPGLSWLVSPSISISSTNAQLAFANSYDLESNPAEATNPVSGQDGGVLDISINGGPWTDILLAGGRFLSGGYTAPIQSGVGNDLQGRPSWTGNSGGFISTVAELPAAAAGHPVRFRWTCGTGEGDTNGGSGWNIDSVAVTETVYDCCNPLIPPALTGLGVTGSQFSFSFQTVAGQTYSLQSCTNIGSPGWTNIQSILGDGTILSLTNSLGGQSRFYRLVSP